MTLEKLEAMQEIANPILNIEEGECVEITEENRTAYYEFSVENFKEESVSDISFWYTIVELYTNEENIQIIDFKTNPIFISNCKKVKQDYKLKITYKGDNTSEISEKIKIKIEAEQEKTYV